MIHGTLLGRLLCDFALVVLIVTLAPGCQGEGKASQQFEQEQPGATKKPKRKPGQPEPYVGDFPSLAKVNIRNAVLEELGSGLEYPWAFGFILLVGPLKGARNHKLGLVKGAILSENRILEEMKGRVRDIKIGADGSIYILSQKGGRIYRLYRDLQSAEREHPRERKGSDIYRMACATCHSDGSELFPQSSDKQAWGDKLAQGRETLEKHAIEGYGSMPPRGLCEGCSDTEIKAAVGFMIERLQ